MPAARTHRRSALDESPSLLALVLVGFALALFGTYWDDAWHTEEGRDSFLVPPHLVLYSGIALAGAALGLWAALNVRARGVRATLGDAPLLLALIGVVTTLVAAPIDNGWHLAFGRDAVIWSPPHMLGVAGTLAIAAAMLLELSASDSPLSRRAAPAAAAGVLAVAAIPVLEYETDVPQFSVLFYLPVLATGAAFALALTRRALSQRFAATLAAAFHAAALIVVVAVLLLLSMPAPLLPLLAIPAVGLDWADRQGLPRAPAAALFTIALFAAYVPYLNLIKDDLVIGFSDVALGLPMAFAGAWLGLRCAGWMGSATRRIPAVAGAAAALPLIVMLSLSARALGHDPGQGKEVGAAVLTASSDGEHARLQVDLQDAPSCSEFEPIRTVARRAGDVQIASLLATGPCRFEGELGLPARGRWFLYAEFDREGETVETWLPIHSGDDETVRDSRVLYVPAESETSWVKIAGSGLVYLAVLSLIVAIGRLYAVRNRENSPDLALPRRN